MSEKWSDHGSAAASAVKRGAEATANGIHTATNLVARNDGRVADGAQLLSQVIGGGLDKGGRILAASSPVQVSQSLHGSATRLALTALSVFMNKNATLREKGAEFGNRSAKAGVSSVVGKMAMVATQTCWLGLIAGVGSSWLASRGHGKREQYEALRGALAVMRYRSLMVVPLTNGR